VNIFKIGSCKLFAQGWLLANVPLISASEVARITDVNHRHLAAFILIYIYLFVFLNSYLFLFSCVH
jgi:hypothetical protein